MLIVSDQKGWRKVLTAFLFFLDFIWELPQNTVGFITFQIFRGRCEHRVEEYPDSDNGILTAWTVSGGLSLGWFTFVSSMSNTRQILHEHGHQIQSRYLGWLYLIVIGLPSLIWAGIHRYICPSWDYYAFYTESWADKLGGVVRG